jgi:hypothetical protein
VEERQAEPSLEDRVAAEAVKVRGAAAIEAVVVVVVGALDVAESAEEAADT